MWPSANCMGTASYGVPSKDLRWFSHKTAHAQNTIRSTNVILSSIDIIHRRPQRWSRFYSPKGHQSIAYWRVLHSILNDLYTAHHTLLGICKSYSSNPSFLRDWCKFQTTTVYLYGDPKLVCLRSSLFSQKIMCAHAHYKRNTKLTLR